MGPRLQRRGPALTLGSASRSGAHLGRWRPGLARGQPRAECGPRDLRQRPGASRTGCGARPAPGALPAPSAPRPAARGPHPSAAPPLSPPSSSAPSPPPPPRRLLGRASEPPGPGAQAARPPHLQRARAAKQPPRLPPPGLPLPQRRVSRDTRDPRPTTMTTSLQDGQSAAGRAAARDSPLTAQVCGAAQGRGDARDLAPAPWLQARALLPPPDGTRGCAADRRKKKDLDVLEMPSIPNPFPELCCSPFTSVLSAGLFPKANSRKKQVIKVYSEDETSRAVEVPSDITARDVCQLLILKNHYIDDHSWTLFEHLPHIGLERTIEDHELVMEVLSNWGMEEENKLYFRKNYAKYEFFKNPMMFLSSSTYPEIHGFLHAKEQGKKSWKKIYFLLRRSGLYFSTKGTSKEPRHLQFFSEFGNSDIYVSLAGKKKHGAPTNYGFCFKPNKAGGPRDLKMLCAEEEQSRTCWVTAIRLLKVNICRVEWNRLMHLSFVCGYGMQLYQNYMHPYQGRSGCSSQSISPMRSISENSLVAMDFSGQKSRVIENPTEALSVAVEEGLAWRKKGCLRLATHGSPTASSQSSATNMAIHRSQPWFHHKISRDEAQRLIIQQGLVDGVFLVRDSQSNPKTFVLSMSHGQKIKHFQIIPVEDDGELFHTLDDGHTRFTDLIQLVEFYQLNKGVLPCKLKHYCARIAL
uniref:Growth factor receptor bound protein 14 n=1 Tax=Felis catus TaxID=9685 RepID=A0ABI7ZFK2_FELCA